MSTLTLTPTQTQAIRDLAESGEITGRAAGLIRATLTKKGALTDDGHPTQEALEAAGISAAEPTVEIAVSRWVNHETGEFKTGATHEWMSMDLTRCGRPLNRHAIRVTDAPLSRVDCPVCKKERAAGTRKARR